MKKTLSTIFLIVMILAIAGVAFVPQPAHASVLDVFSCVFGKGSCLSTAAQGSWVVGLFAEIGNTVLSIVSYFLSLMGIILNISIILTMNIKAIFEATPAIEQVWVVIRNLASIFIIFGLLYSSILTILDIGKPSLKALIGKIILAGLFINFSLFFTKVAIDGSNLVSLQFYRAIAPDAKVVSITKDGFGAFMSGAMSDPGISDIFMHSLKIPTVYNNKSAITPNGAATAFNIATATIAGSILMIFAGLSFLAAAIAFVVRLVILLLLMGFSPIYFIGMIFPAIQKDISGKWMKWLSQELIFMPVYLLFMYVALKFISSGDGNNFFDALSTASAGAGKGGVMLSMVGLGIQYTIAFILINIPLLAAIQVGGIGVKWGENAKNWVGGYMGKNTLGYVGSKLDKRWEGTKLGNSVFGRSVRDLTTTKLANSKFGGYSTRKDDEKLNKEVKKKGREIDNLKRLDVAIAAKNHAEIKKILGNMSTNEIASLDTDKYLTNEHVLPHVSSAVYKNIEKGDKSDKDKAKIKEVRFGKLSSAVAGSRTQDIKDIMKNMSGEELQEYIEDNTPPGAPISDDLVAHIRTSQLKDMDGMDETLRKQIGDSIWLWTGKYTNNHQAYKFIDDNKAAWKT